jgi:hypothetical protein
MQQLNQLRRRQQLPTKFRSGRAAVVSKFLAGSGGAASPVLVGTLIKSKDLMHCGASGGKEEEQLQAVPPSEWDQQGGALVRCGRQRSHPQLRRRLVRRGLMQLLGLKRQEH